MAEHLLSGADVAASEVGSVEHLGAGEVTVPDLLGPPGRHTRRFQTILLNEKAKSPRLQ
jgi:hypothetical protein